MVDSCFWQRRSSLFHQMPDNSLAVVASGSLCARNRDSDFPFRVDSDFWYLTGFDEPDALLLLEKSCGNCTSHIFVQENNKQQELWTGRRLGVDAAPESLGINKSYPRANFTELMPDFLQNKESLLSIYGQNNLSQILQNFFSGHSAKRSIDGYVHKWQNLAVMLHQMRLRKSHEEIELMRQAAMISSLGHVQMMRAAKPGRYEYQLAAVMQFESMMQGAVYQAYNPIVANGANACILHYNNNNAELQKDKLVLIDAGCELGYYASDITRTFPVSGRFLGWQKDLYQLVLKSQQEAIAVCISGNQHSDIHDAAVAVLCDGLIELGLLTEPRDQIIEQKLYHHYLMHGTSHWLGLDVHDVGNYTYKGQPTILEPGMVLTVEPGLYIAEDDERAPKEWRGTGIRIEDNVHITLDKPDILTIGAPKDVQEITAIIGQTTGQRS